MYRRKCGGVGLIVAQGVKAISCLAIKTNMAGMSSACSVVTFVTQKSSSRLSDNQRKKG